MASDLSRAAELIDGPGPKPSFITVASAEKYWIEKSRRDPLAFIEYVTEKTPARHHRLWCREILDPNQKRILIISPREAAKTFFLVHLMAWVIGKAPWSTNFIGSVSDDQAKERIRVIKDLIQYNTRYQNVFPWIHLDHTQPNTVHQFTVWSEKWTEDTPGTIQHRMWKSLVSRFADPRNPTLFGAGSGSASIIGKRFSGIALIDDPHDAKNSATEGLREKYELWFDGSFLPTVQETAKVVIITTRWAETDIAGRKKAQKDSGGKKIWKTIELPAILKSGKSYWPEYWPLPKLKAKQEEVGPIMWELMYMNNPLGLSTGQFDLDMLRKDLPNPLPKLRDIVISLDLAASEKNYSDYTVIAALARDLAKPVNVYLLDMVRGKFSMSDAFDEIVKFYVKLMQEYGTVNKILFERASFQSSWAEELKNRHDGLPIDTIPITGDKGSRLTAVAGKAQAGRFFVNQQIKDLLALQSELIAFPKGQHDDIPDALSLPFQFWGIGITSVKTRLIFGSQ